MRAKPFAAVAVSVAEVIPRSKETRPDSAQRVRASSGNTTTWARTEPINLGIEYIEILRLRTWLATMYERDHLFYTRTCSVPYIDTSTGSRKEQELLTGLRIHLKASTAKESRKLVMDLDASFTRIAKPIDKKVPRTREQSISLFSLIDEESQLVIGGLLKRSDLEQLETGGFVQRIEAIELSESQNPDTELVLILRVYRL